MATFVHGSMGGHDVGDLCWSMRANKVGWVMCQSQALMRTTYSLLFGTIGTTFGAGDGSTTFNVPDGRGRFLVGAGTGTLTESVAAASVTAASDSITVASNIDKWITGMKVQMTTTTTLPTGISAATDYYVIRVNATTIKLASTLANALAGTAVDITAAGSGTHTLTHLLSSRALGGVGGEESHASTALELPTHTHSTTQSFYWERGTGGMAGYGAGSVIDRDPIVTNPTGGNLAHNNMPPYLGANLFIFAGV